ncbi:uncharacterized protein LOC110459115 [Mizuhopecten yessoensis]|uniref:Zinc finger protein 26 n=1 Tax=Mizuhopecten yessoensis TaxID=6573 RepID=A0A210Q595_MIZYE|nr:uncharacterized protein LOC110459115 [Mizuhopecten yessoensis]OWF43891.1 Zinc finger protein 26 [Mizuhopecten yessoensis]
MAALNRNGLQMKLSSISNETAMGDEGQLLMDRIEGSEKELPPTVGADTEVVAEKGRQKELFCHYCNKVFYKQKNLKVHLCIHTGEKKLQCNTCGKCFIQSCHLKRHLRSHSGEKPYSCDICGNQFSQNGHLRVHLKSHFGNKNYKCEYCPMAFVQNSHLKRHMRSHMTIRPYKCDMCDKTYKFSDHLYIHLRRHTGETPYHCTFCDKAFHTSANLNAHVKIHNKYVDRKFKCQVCVKKFHTNYALMKHMAVHTSDTPFSCRLCPKSFKYKGNLKHHFDVHSNDEAMKLLKCVICVKRCSSFQSLKDHMLSHYEENCKTPKCEICNKTFRIKSSLQMHYSLHTGQKLAYRCLEVPCQFESRTIDEMKDHGTSLHSVKEDDGSEEHTLTDDHMTSCNEMEDHVSGTGRKFKCPMGCSHSFDNITDLVSHLKCHIKLEKNRKSVDHRSGPSSVARVNESGTKGTGIGIFGNASDIHSFQVKNGKQDKPVSPLDPVSMLIETAEQVLPNFYHQSCTGGQIQEESNEKMAEGLLQLHHKPVEKRQILIEDHSNYLQRAGTSPEGGFVVSDRQFSNSPSEKETISFSIIVPEKTVPEMSKPSKRPALQNPILVRTLSGPSSERNTQPASTMAQPFKSLGSTVGEQHSNVTISSMEISGNSCQTQEVGDICANNVVRESNALWIDSAETNHSFIIEGNDSCQSLVIGGHVIKMLDNSRVNVSTKSVQEQGENIQEIVVDERTMHELVIGTSEVPFSVGVDARFHQPEHGTNYHQLSVDEVEEVIIQTKPKEATTKHVFYSSQSVPSVLERTLNKEMGNSDSSMESRVGTKDEDITVASSIQQKFVSNTNVQETNEAKLQYVPYSSENNVFIDSIGDHGYVLSHGENSVVSCENTITEGQERVLEEISGTPDITKYTGYPSNLSRDAELDILDAQDVGVLRCPFCNEHFQDDSVLKVHLQSHMNPEKIVVNVVMYMCHLCNAEFNSRESLKAHLQTHV